jgi:hypothetical protein
MSDTLVFKTLSESDIQALPADLQTVITEISSIDDLLTQYEKNGRAQFMKQAATKIKNSAPIIKNIAASESVKSNEGSKDLLRKLMGDLKILFMRAKNVRGFGSTKLLLQVDR